MDAQSTTGGATTGGDERPVKKRKREGKEKAPELCLDSQQLFEEYCRRDGLVYEFDIKEQEPKGFVGTVTVSGAAHVGDMKLSKDSAKRDACDAFFKALLAVAPATEHEIAVSWREPGWHTGDGVSRCLTRRD